MKKTISILVIVAMMLASLLAIIPVAAADPEGTAITNADEFAAMTAEGKYYLANDITLKDSYGDFKGTLDGNGKTITLTGKTPAFKNLTGATVKNVNVVAKYEGADLGGNYGALAVTVNGGTYTGINADVELTFTAPVTNNIGAIFGEVKGTTTITDSVSDGFVKIANNLKAAEKGTGGIIGVVTSGNITVRNCVNYFDIQSYIVRGSNGGIIGRIIATPVTVENCANYGVIETVTGGDNKDGNGNMHCGNGGIVGQFESPTSTTPALNIKNCRNYGNITGKRLETNTYEGNCMLGGILGRIYGSKYVTIEGCINSGNVVSEDQGGTWTCVGGMIGNAETWNYTWATITEADLVIRNCVNTGNVKAPKGHAGGIFGGLLQGNAPDIRAFMDSCANYGAVEGQDAGGIFGATDHEGGATITLNNSYNAGTITGVGASGGIIAKINSKWFTGNGVQDKEIILNGELAFPGATLTNCINDGAVSGGTTGTIWGSSNSPAKLIKSGSTVEGDLTGFDAVEITEAPADVAAAKTALLAAIPANPTELTELVEEANNLYADDYTAGWDAYAEVMAQARTLVNQALEVETNAELVASIKEAKEGLVALTDVNRDALDAALEDAAEITNPDNAKYTPKTWAAFAAALDAAQKVAADAKQSAINKAAEALTAAMAGLELIPDLDALTAKIETAKAVDQTLYVTKTLTALNDAIKKADALLVDENATGSQVNAIIADIDAAIAALAAKVDPKPLSDKITATEAQYKPEVYTAMTYGKVKGAIADAKDAIEDNDMSQADLDAFVKAIDDAIKGLKNKATWTDTDAFLATVENLRDTDYTKESWKDYTEALNKVQGYMKEDKKLNVSVEDEAKYLAELKAAYEALVAYATYGAIDTRVGELDALDKTKYTAESWKALQDAIKAANALKSDRYATQPQADEALAAINAAVEALVEAGANSGDATTPTTNNGGDATEPEKKGCGGVIATTAVVMTSVLALGAAFVAKKKED